MEKHKENSKKPSEAEEKENEEHKLEEDEEPTTKDEEDNKEEKGGASASHRSCGDMKCMLKSARVKSTLLTTALCLPWVRTR